MELVSFSKNNLRIKLVVRSAASLSKTILRAFTKWSIKEKIKAFYPAPQGKPDIAYPTRDLLHLPWNPDQNGNL